MVVFMGAVIDLARPKFYNQEFNANLILLNIVAFAVGYDINAIVHHYIDQPS